VCVDNNIENPTYHAKFMILGTLKTQNKLSLVKVCIFKSSSLKSKSYTVAKLRPMGKVEPRKDWNLREK